MSATRKIGPNTVSFYMHYDNTEVCFRARPKGKFIKAHRVHCKKHDIKGELLYFVDGKEINKNWRNMTYRELGIVDDSEVRSFILLC